MKTVQTSDTHGEISSLVDILQHAELIDENLDWIGQDSKFIHTGDEIDRGPFSLETREILRKLQLQAADNGGKVVRHIGNHELMILQGDYRYANFPNPTKVAADIRDDILRGRMLAASTNGVTMYSHAGIHNALLPHLPRESHGRFNLPIMAAYINNTFRRLVAQNTLDPNDHPILWVGRERGGWNPAGGIFWTDYRELSNHHCLPPFAQTVGHTPSRTPALSHTDDLRLINLDAGMATHYGRNLAYLTIDESGNHVQNSKREGTWHQTPLQPVHAQKSA